MLIALGVLSLAALASLVITYRRLADARAVERWGLLAVRALLFTCLMAVLMGPSRMAEKVRSRPPVVAILADTSESMSVKDEEGGSRAEAAARAMNALRQRLHRRAETVVYAFDATVRRLEGEIKPEAEGRQTDIRGGLAAVGGGSASRGPEAIVLVSDGRDTVGGDTAVQSGDIGAGAPVFCVAVGSTEPPADVRLAALLAPPVVSVDAPAQALVKLRSSGLDGKNATVTLKVNDRETARRRVKLGAAGLNNLTLSFRAERPGPMRLTAEVLPISGEITRDNNQHSTFVLAKPKEAKLLYAAGEPSQEYAFLHRTLLGMDKVKTDLRLRKAPGLWWREAPLKKADLPTAAELKKYDAVIIGDVEAQAWGAPRLRALADLATERGGGLLLLAGPRCWARSSGDTPLGSLLPVERGSAGFSEVFVRLSGAAAARDHPLAAALRAALEHAEDLPFLAGLAAAGKPKPGAATVLIAHRATGQEAPALVVQRAGAGRVGVLLAGGTFRWQFSDQATQESRRAYTRFWSSLVDWLTRRTNDRPVALVLSREVCSVETPVRAVVRVWDEGFDPVADAEVELLVADAEGQEASVRLSPVVGEAGRYEGSWAPRRPGVHKVRAVARRGGRTLGQNQRALAVEDRSVELDDPRADLDALRRIAEETGGRFFRVGEADKLVAALPLGPVTEQVRLRVEPLRAIPVLWAIIVLAALDWGLRRRWRGE